MYLKKGDTGVKVTYLQYGLHILCCTPGSFDGSFGDATEKAVRKYQEAYGLEVDGQAGDATWNSISGEIKPIQRALSMKGYYHSSIDGVAGEGTYNGVVEFQKEHGLAADGQVGPATRAVLLRDGSVEVGDADFPLKEGDRGSKVKYLQYGLRILCCSPGSLDGVFGEGTYEAVVKFQQKYNLSADGIVASGTWGKMEELILEIQRALVQKGYSIGATDGVAGPGTYEGVRQFQADQGLSVDGQVGPATREKLLGSVGDGGNDAFPLKKGSSGPYVLFLQRGLRMMVINPNGVDGSFGTGTEEAVKRFQERYGLSADGIVGTATWEKMRTLIKPIQQALVNHGYDTGGVDGIAGDKTYSAVMDFQEDNGLSPDGMVGTATQQKLGITVGSGGGSGTTSATLKNGSNGSLTRYLQRILSELGYSLTIDGIFGSAMENAVKAFQQKYGLSADGIIGSGTWNKIFSVYKVKASGTGVAKFVNVAKHEWSWAFQEDNSNNITPYGQWYGMQGQAWCAMFVSWCAEQAGILGTKVPRYAYCPSGVEWYRSRGKFYSRSGGYVPRVGDTVFFWGASAGRVSHTGIVIQVTSSQIQTVEGNTGDGVGMHYYDRTDTYIHGYGCNDGPESSEEDGKPTQEQIDLAMSRKWRQLLDTTGNNLAALNLSKENFNVELEVVNTPYYRVTTEFSNSTAIFEEADFTTEFDIEDGTITYSGTSVLGTIETSFGVQEEDEVMVPVIELAVAIGDGKGKTEIGVEGEWLKLSYVYEAEVEVSETWREKFSYKYTIWIKPVPPEEGGAPETQGASNKVFQYAVATAVVVGVCVAFYMFGGAAAVAAAVTKGIQVVGAIGLFFTNALKVIA